MSKTFNIYNFICIGIYLIGLGAALFKTGEIEPSWAVWFRLVGLLLISINTCIMVLRRTKRKEKR